MQFHAESRSERITYSFPLQREVKAALHFLNLRKAIVRAGLDIGFTNSWVSQTFRQTGGYWMTVEMTATRRGRVATALGDDTVLTAGRNGELPFEDKQFDVVIVSCAMLTANPDTIPALLRECHRILKIGGHLIFTVSREKRHSEEGLFHLLRDGFDVLDFRYSCRFWVQLVRNWELRHNDPNAPPGFITRCLYLLAKILDLFFFFIKGYQMTVFCHRKGWREKRTSLIPSAAPVSEAILCDPRRNHRGFATTRFK